MNPHEIIHFWFEEVQPERWWRSDAALDAMMRARFETVHRAASRGELADCLFRDKA